MARKSTEAAPQPTSLLERRAFKRVREFSDAEIAVDEYRFAAELYRIELAYVEYSTRMAHAEETLDVEYRLKTGFAGESYEEIQMFVIGYHGLLSRADALFRLYIAQLQSYDFDSEALKKYQDYLDKELSAASAKYSRRLIRVQNRLQQRIH